MKRTNCGACGATDLRIILDLGLSPIADAYTATSDEISAQYPLQLVHCEDCGLVQLLEVVDHETLFGTGYSFYSSASAPLSAYHERYAHDIINQRATQTPFVVEIGCNDGDMLRHFQAANCEVLGIDPAVGPVSFAMHERRLDVMLKPFTRALGLEIHAQRGPADIVIANHVLAHVEDVSNVLAGIAELLSPTGMAYVEVQYLPDLLLNNAFDLVYHEHRNFFSLTTLERAVERHDMRVVSAKLTDRQGGSLRVGIRHGRPTANMHTRGVQGIRASELWLSSSGAYDGLQHRAERIRERFLGLLATEMESGRIIIGYGAPAKATTLLNFCGINSTMIDYVVDTTVAKQDRYIPGTGLKIKKPKRLGTSDSMQTTYILLAWNYVGHILRHEHNFTDREGRWIIPIPVPTLI